MHGWNLAVGPHRRSALYCTVRYTRDEWGLHQSQPGTRIASSTRTGGLRLAESTAAAGLVSGHGASHAAAAAAACRQRPRVTWPRGGGGRPPWRRRVSRMRARARRDAARRVPPLAAAGACGARRAGQWRQGPPAAQRVGTRQTGRRSGADAQAGGGGRGGGGTTSLGRRWGCRDGDAFPAGWSGVHAPKADAGGGVERCAASVAARRVLGTDTTHSSPAVGLQGVTACRLMTSSPAFHTRKFRWYAPRRRGMLFVTMSASQYAPLSSLPSLPPPLWASVCTWGPLGVQVPHEAPDKALVPRTDRVGPLMRGHRRHSPPLPPAAPLLHPESYAHNRRLSCAFHKRDGRSGGHGGWEPEWSEGDGVRGIAARDAIEPASVPVDRATTLPQSSLGLLRTPGASLRASLRASPGRHLGVMRP